jgi:uncharacterized small protein (DUF1192 family)
VSSEIAQITGEHECELCEDEYPCYPVKWLSSLISALDEIEQLKADLARVAEWGSNRARSG